MNSSNFNIEDINPNSSVYKIAIDQKHTREIEGCIICKTNSTNKKNLLLCLRCYEKIFENFPEKYFPKETAINIFNGYFNRLYKQYDRNKGFIIISIPLGFTCPFSVVIY
ncbi:MAG: hypothetical protein ACFFCI_22670 [Promethearchaeota archaeon]